MVRSLSILALLLTSSFASAMELDCSFPSAQEPLRLRFHWDPAPGRGAGFLHAGQQVWPVQVLMVHSVWWGLGEEVLFTRVEFRLPDGAVGELRDFPAGTEPDSISVPLKGGPVRAFAASACASR